VGFAVAAGYAIVALVLLVGTNPRMAVPFAYTAVSIAGPLAVAGALLRSSRPDDAGGDDPPDDGPGPHDDGGDDSPPPWWPEFEREFHAHVERHAAREGSEDRPVVPA
jgi:hypothetical protein